MANKKTETRQTIERDPRNPEPHLDSGYEGDSVSEDFFIPSCGVEDVDYALFNLFDKHIGFAVKNVTSANKKVAIKKPFVIFATGERFALAKRLNVPRNKNKALILPAISIRRTGITQTSDDINGRGINQHTGQLVIKRKLDESDKDYQNLINKIGLINADLTGTERATGSQKNHPHIKAGGLLTPLVEDGKNMWEIITIPQPQYFTSNYEVTFWTNYSEHMNYLVETYISSFLPQARCHKLGTEKGYWFMAYTEDNFSSNENFEEFEKDSRVVRYTFNISVKAYLLTPEHETNKVPCRRWISTPIVNFDNLGVDNLYPKKYIKQLKKENANANFSLTDTNRDPETAQTPTTEGRYYTEKQRFDRKTGKIVTDTVGILESNQKKGETVFYASSVKSFEDFVKSLGS